jgi:hypothetical protein
MPRSRSASARFDAESSKIGMVHPLESALWLSASLFPPDVSRCFRDVTNGNCLRGGGLHATVGVSEVRGSSHRLSARADHCAGCRRARPSPRARLTLNSAGAFDRPASCWSGGVAPRRLTPDHHARHRSARAYNNIASSSTVAAHSVPTAISKSPVISARLACRSKQIRWQRCTKRLR